LYSGNHYHVNLLRMQKHLLLIIFAVAGIFCQKTFPQSGKQFTDDPSVFASEITGFMGKNLTQEQTVKFEGFIRLWDSAAFNTEEMKALINTANLLFSRNARPVPHMLNYLELVKLLTESGRARHHDVLKVAFIRLLESGELSIPNFNELVLLIEGLVSGNMLYSSIAVKWESSGSEFYFVFDDSLRIVFPEINLRGYNHIDTICIYGTSGVMCPLTRTWKGKGGRVTWERTGLTENEAYALLNNYKIRLSRSEYIADSAFFNFSRYFHVPIIGRLTDRVVTSGPEKASYPRFTSYRQEFSIKDVYQNVDYEGGLSMHGSRLIGSGGNDRNARLSFFRENSLSLKAESGHFVFNQQGVSSLSTRVIFYLENDSVFHPDLHLNYNDNFRRLSLNQNDKVISKSPWDNQFHQIDMSFARLLWNIDEPEMIFTMPGASSIGNANFRSLNYFDRSQYQQMQGMDLNHPLLSLRSFAGSHDSGAFPATEYANYLRMPVSGVRHQLLELTLGGFIFYDTETDLIRTRQRLYDYLLANIRRIDYDVINFFSTTSSPVENATLDLGSFEMKINGIPRVHISNTQNVNLYPAKNTVKLKRNRNFLFDGTVNAGNISFFGSTFTFDYDKFDISLQNIDSLRMRVPLNEKDVRGEARLATVGSLIRNVTGDLHVDKPFNKSGRVQHPDYPKFSSTGNSYVFFDGRQIQNGVYGQDKFYFELYPFMLDSLNGFSK
jgi:hypothetical protein